MKGWFEANMHGKEKITRELLAACRDARDQITALCSEADVPDSVTKAIARAEGESRD